MLMMNVYFLVALLTPFCYHSTVLTPLLYERWIFFAGLVAFQSPGVDVAASRLWSQRGVAGLGRNTRLQGESDARR